MFKLPKLHKGFTLIELMVVISIIAILSTIALFGIGKAQATGRDAKRSSIMNGIRTALERYYADTQKYPTGNFGEAVTTLVGGGYLPVAPTDPSGACTTGVQATGTWLPCGAGTVPVYSYSSAAGTYAKGTTANCTVAQNCYYLWLKPEANGTSGTTYQEYSSPK